MLLQRAVLPLGGLPFVILLLAAGTGVRAALPTTVVTNVVAEETQSSGAPVLVHITVTNAGQAPLTYWCGGPATYPGAHHFVAHVTDEPGRTREAHLSNGQYQMGSGTERQVLPGQSVTLPAALEPLPAGTYTIQVGNGKLVRVIINDDEQLAVKREQNVLKRARQGEPFAQHVAARFPADSITRALLQDLGSKEEQVSLRAATTLSQFEKLPADSGPLVEIAMQIHLTAELNEPINPAGNSGRQPRLGSGHVSSAGPGRQQPRFADAWTGHQSTGQIQARASRQSPARFFERYERRCSLRSRAHAGESQRPGGHGRTACGRCR